MGLNPGLTKAGQPVQIENSSGTVIDPATEQTLQKVLGFQIPVYDYISFGYTGSNLTTVQYYLGGSGGTLVATLTLAYTGSNLTSVTKS